MPHMDREQLRIAGLTGVDIKLNIAGPGSRSFAFIIDWHIRLLCALGWLLVCLIFIRNLFGSKAIAYVVAAPALVIYFLYHPILETFSRTTPGKRMAGVRIVTRQGGTPSVGAMLVRNLFRLVDSLPTLYLVGLLSCMLSEQRVRVGDMAAGTLLVVEDVDAEQSLRTFGAQLSATALPAHLIELVNDLMHRWPWLDTTARDRIARLVLARADATLTPENLGSMNDQELRRRLGALRAAA
jgi:uncharacterized RDD family membrane protein YckC